MKNFFLSLKTTVWTLFILVCLLFLGSYMMPAYRHIFAGMNEDILLQWAAETAVRNPWHTWWLFAALAGLVVLTVNTLVCSYLAIRGRWSRSEFFLRISPQMVHAGFLFILLAHLLSATAGYKISGMLPEGASGGLPGNLALSLDKMQVQTDSAGYISDWKAHISIRENGIVLKSGTLGPNAPVFYRGTGVYLKTLNFDRGPAAILMVVQDPGAVWALVGSILFLIGSAMLLVLKWKKTT